MSLVKQPDATPKRQLPVDIDEQALLRMLSCCDQHASDVYCAALKGKRQLQQLLLKASTTPQK